NDELKRFRISEQAKKRMNATRQSRDTRISLEQWAKMVEPENKIKSPQNSELQQELHETKNELDATKRYLGRLESQINELEVVVEIKDKVNRALERQIQ